MEKAKSIESRLLIGMILISIAIVVFTEIGVGFVYWNDMQETYKTLAYSYTDAVAEYVDGDKVAGFYEAFLSGEDITDTYYEETMEYVDTLITNNPEIRYLYMFYPEPDEIIYILDAINEDGRTELGAAEAYEEGEYASLMEFMSGKKDHELIVSNWGQFGYIGTAYSPIKNSDGKTIALVGMDISMDKVRSYLIDFAKVVLLTVLLVIALSIGMLFFYVRKHVTRPIEKLDEASKEMVKKLENGEESRIVITGAREIVELGETLNTMNDEVRDFTKRLATMTAENERIGTELNVATKIQADLLPKIIPEFPNRKELDIYAIMTPAKEVGGDFYDFFFIEGDKLGMVMADVSGKGVPAALFMVIAKTLIKNQASNTGNPSTILEIVNNQLCENNASEMFVTCWLGILDIATGHVDAVNAGHEYPSVMRANGDFELLRDKHGIALAAMEDMGYAGYSFELSPGDKLFLYTDGVPEATDSENVLFGTDRMLEALNKHKSETPEQLLVSVKEEIDSFVGEAPQFDDITMLALTYNGPQNA